MILNPDDYLYERDYQKEWWEPLDGEDPPECNPKEVAKRHLQHLFKVLDCFGLNRVGAKRLIAEVIENEF
jgi:hypothetical protein